MKCWHTTLTGGCPFYDRNEFLAIVEKLQKVNFESIKLCIRYRIETRHPWMIMCGTSPEHSRCSNRDIQPQMNSRNLQQIWNRCQPNSPLKWLLYPNNQQHNHMEHLHLHCDKGFLNRYSFWITIPRTELGLNPLLVANVKSFISILTLSEPWIILTASQVVVPGILCTLSSCPFAWEMFSSELTGR